jgi:H+/Cl- antiporter ClcA
LNKAISVTFSVLVAIVVFAVSLTLAVVGGFDLDWYLSFLHSDPRDTEGIQAGFRAVVFLPVVALLSLGVAGALSFYSYRTFYAKLRSTKNTAGKG